MKLAEQCFKIIRNELVTANITAYSDYIPDETQYPFVMYEIVDMSNSPDWAFEKDYEKLTVRFNIHDNSFNPGKTVEIAETIEGIFDRTHLEFTDTTTGKHLICCYKVNDSIGYDNDEQYWITTGDYIFQAQRDI